jgi:hypothetical protein
LSIFHVADHELQLFSFRFKDGDNCCDDPYANASLILNMPSAAMQGIVIGRLNDSSIMQQITQRTPIMASSNYWTNGNTSAIAAGQALAYQINTFLENTRRNGSCPPIPPGMFYCVYSNSTIDMPYYFSITLYDSLS